MKNLAKSARTRKLQAFLLTCFFFSPLLLFFVSFSNIFKIEMKGQDTLSLAMGQFVARGEFVAPKLTPTPSVAQKEKKPKKEPKKKDKDKKENKKKEEDEQKQEQSVTGGAQVANAQPAQIGTLAYGKDDNPFLREIKAAIDKAARETYPRQAVKMRLSGRVWLEFVWLTNNSLQAVRIVQSSGSQLLDRNVFKIVARASKDFPAYKDDIRIQIPIDYNLR